MLRHVARNPAGNFTLAVPFIVFAVAVGGLFIATRPVFTIDTQQLASGARVTHDCFVNHVFGGCGAHGKTSEVQPFPLLQYPFAYVFERAGASDATTIRLLGGVNLLAVVALGALTWLVTSRIGRSALAPLVTAVVVFSPLLFYAHAGFGEGLAAFAIALATAAALLRWPPGVVAACFLFAGVTKETAAPFLLAVGLIALYGTEVRARRRHLVGVAGGLIAAIAVNAAFNVFRFGEPLNHDYARTVFRMPGGLRTEYFGGLLASPSAGLLIFWLAAVVLVAFVIAAGVRDVSTLREVVRRPVVWLALVVVALLASFASWFGPLGGVAWGPRLLVPWIPAIVLLAVALRGRDLEAAIGKMARMPLVFIVAGALFCAAALPQVLGPVDAAGYDHRTLQLSADEVWLAPHLPTPECPVFYDVKRDSEGYYQCLHRTTWRVHPWVIARAYRALDQPPLLLYGVLTLAALIGLLALTWTRAAGLAADRYSAELLRRR